jgi:hypothetical protein
MMSSIGIEAFQGCKAIKTISIPSSVMFLGEFCFGFCEELEAVLFLGDSQLKTIPEKAFAWCYSLTSIIVPPSLKTLGDSCFLRCGKLGTSPLSLGSQVVRIEPWAFSFCASLKSLFIPSTVEFIGRSCFHRCHLLQSLTCEEPSHLRELLDLPPELEGFLAIPDSVEILSFGHFLLPVAPILTFGANSKLTEVRGLPFLETHPRRSYLHVSTPCLKIFRTNLEFRTNGAFD